MGRIPQSLSSATSGGFSLDLIKLTYLWFGIQLLSVAPPIIYHGGQLPERSPLTLNLVVGHLLNAHMVA